MVRGVVGKETHLVVVVADDGQVAKDGRANLETQSRRLSSKAPLMQLLLADDAIARSRI